MADKFALQKRVKTAGETRNVAVSFDDELDVDEQLTGTPTIVDVGGVLTLDNKVVSTAELEINDKTVAIGRAVQFSVEGGVAGTTYTVRITCTTTSTPTQTVIGKLYVKVVSDS